MVRYERDRPEADEPWDDDPGDDFSDPRHPDHDLSEWSPTYYRDLEPPAKPWYLRRWLMLLVALVVIGSLLLPYIMRS